MNCRTGSEKSSEGGMDNKGTYITDSKNLCGKYLGVGWREQTSSFHSEYPTHHHRVNATNSTMQQSMDAVEGSNNNNNNNNNNSSNGNSNNSNAAIGRAMKNEPAAVTVPSAVASHVQMAQCANCLILEWEQTNFRTCAQCKEAQYCSKDCQRMHWKLAHRGECKSNEPNEKTTSSINTTLNANTNATATANVLAKNIRTGVFQPTT
ncbi:hypothetical protein RFI_15599 [Reticulomyxa filosa]|uniref:MYND-type domain-containing protein n=1 Tax=Reticulomyxa filosa TaxID=46433 RepID=X6N5P5_RETFI|nr:hypothetical protein RFI_15599 [Reticulomyxa filosa]|eukprot:ETO21605.1 hypothetical protein RFI_15599 [Reticulomyxa filosa]